jgi:hypothetical protein
MLGKKALGSDARGERQQTQGTACDMRENPVGDVGVEFGQPLFSDSRLFPKNPFRVRWIPIGAAATRRFAGFCSVSRTISSGGLSSLSPLNAAARSSLFLRPAAIFDLADEARLGPSDTFLDAA